MGLEEYSAFLYKYKLEKEEFFKDYDFKLKSQQRTGLNLSKAGFLEV